MTQRRKKRPSKSGQEFPGWVWMMFGLAIGLSVALAIYINSRTPAAPQHPATTQRAAAVSDALDDNGEAAVATQAPDKPRFEFYNMLPNFEVVIAEQEPDVSADTGPQAIVRPGLYVLQAGSFTKYEDADRRRAQLAMQGIESAIQRVAIDDKTYHRVRIGPIDDLDELNLLRSRLRQAQIDVLRIRLGD